MASAYGSESRGCVSSSLLDSSLELEDSAARFSRARRSFGGVDLGRAGTSEREARGCSTGDGTGG